MIQEMNRLRTSHEEAVKEMRAKAETELKEKVDKLEEKRQKAVAEAEADNVEDHGAVSGDKFACGPEHQESKCIHTEDRRCKRPLRSTRKADCMKLTKFSGGKTKSKREKSAA